MEKSTNQLAGDTSSLAYLDFDVLPSDLKSYISQRYQEYGINPEEGYDSHVPDEFKVQGSDAIRAFFEKKDISHKVAQSNGGDNDVQNTFLEDFSVNRARGDRDTTLGEELEARQDNLRDAYDGDIDEDGVMDFTPDHQALLTHQHSQAEISQQVDFPINSQNGTILEPVIEDAAAVSLSEADLGQVIAENEELLGELAEGSAAAGVTGAFSVAFYVALKTILSMEGARRRGEVGWMDVAEKTVKEVSRVLPVAMAASLILGILTLLFGSWILIPLMPFAAYYGIKAPVTLFSVYWQGLDEAQRAELKTLAKELGGKIARAIQELDAKKDSSAPA